MLLVSSFAPAAARVSPGTARLSAPLIRIRTGTAALAPAPNAIDNSMPRRSRGLSRLMASVSGGNKDGVRRRRGRSSILPLFYNDVYRVDLPERHRFPMEKYRLVREVRRRRQ